MENYMKREENKRNIDLNRKKHIMKNVISRDQMLLDMQKKNQRHNMEALEAFCNTT